MKKSFALLLILLFAFAVNSYSQSTVDTEACLSKGFKKSELKAMSADELAYQRFVIENAVQIYPVPEGKPMDMYPTKNWVVNSDVCIYDLKVKIQPETRINFISENGNLVMIYSEKELGVNYRRKNK
jgi:hypothetical protein